MWKPFSEQAADLPTLAEDAVRLLPVERSPFQEPAVPAPQPAAPVPGARRPLGPGGRPFSAPDTQAPTTG
ncbi:hypothetical protein [Kitasatospora aureofaciens]|uniref:hypothetical protein n=1 Tax=Kitasatospora aureofaciens TaxID=1894 RepID=UPI0005240BAD|nr:hypothetical protein [Kitasatospora aureofaciens]